MVNLVRFILRNILTKLYKIEVKGLENYEKAGNRVLIIANHLSFLDAALLAIFLPKRPMFAINTYIAQKWLIKPFLMLVDVYKVDASNPMATKTLINEIKKDKKCVIFPEGRITVTGSLMKIYEGPGMIASKSDAVILPIRIDGAQYSPLSRLKGRVRIKMFPKVTLTILEPIKFPKESNGGLKSARAKNADLLYDIMTDMLFESSDIECNLFKSLIDVSKICGLRHQVVVDIGRQNLTYGDLISRSFILGSKLKDIVKKDEYLGFMLPNMSSSIVLFFALQAYGIVPAMLNFSTGVKNLISSCGVAKIQKIITSRKFIQDSNMDNIIESLVKQGIEIIYLEDVKDKISFVDKIKGLVRSKIPYKYFATINDKAPEDVAVILFTSGSEGVPKGVALSHGNLQANRYQLGSRIDLSSKDIVFNSLPIFHSFGLTAGTILPILSGIRTFFYPSPLHYKIVPELIYDIGATIMFGTNTFLSGYARFAHPYDFYSLRYVFSGAEKLDEEVRRIWNDKFGVRIFEGYGATETSPILASNTPMYNKVGTVGKFMPAIKYKLEKVDGINDGKKLLVSGPNIMKGYLLESNPGKIIKPKNNWYDTGDIVDIDMDGFITIKGRAKRFAKIAGEMVSLTAVEVVINSFWLDGKHAIVAIPDAKKGEQLVLITTNKEIKKEVISRYFKESGISEISVPRNIKIVDEIPLLGTGKIDYVKVKDLALT